MTNSTQTPTQTRKNETRSNLVTVHCCDDCGCEVDYDTGYCAACDSYPPITTVLSQTDEDRPASHCASGGGVCRIQS
jgi:predicted ATP-dependent serine protease